MVLLDYFLSKYSYYNKPEGEDPAGKIIGLAKYVVIPGFVFSVYDALFYSNCQNAFQFLNTAGYWVIPLTGMCTAFSGVTYIATNLRKKDDVYNYALGALASGSVLHAWIKCPRRSGVGTFAMVLYAMLKKDHKINNYTKGFFVPEKPIYKWYLPWRNVPYRNYLGKPKYEHNREDYYIKF